jgi:hypothetical protein
MQFVASSIVRSTAIRMTRVTLACLTAGACIGAHAAAEVVGPASGTGGPTMWRCPGNEYNNTLSAKEAQAKGCKTIEGAPITIIQSSRPRPVPTTSGPTSTRVDPADQRARDSDARRILEGELKIEQDRLASMKADYNNGQPERQGNEKNYAKYQDRVADMKAAITRKESDIAALQRELAKTAQTQ